MLTQHTEARAVDSLQSRFMARSSSPRKPVLFTFGNHMHWVDMQWLWGYHVLPGSVRDMLHLCRETGVKGNVNFDAIGYEKMAAECPEALAELRAAVANGTIEPVGCSYGQPYGLFHGGESNIRQFTYGVRTTRRLLGVRPRAFWEEEFYFYPQLPQILRSCGYTSANLFFQWTWHTPEVPREQCALIQWEGIDGTRIPALPRNELNLHQWPEDFALLSPSLEATRTGGGRGGGESLLHDLPLPAIVQWLELMPSKDWMCRSELLLPKLKELLAHEEYEIIPCTMSEMVERLTTTEEPPIRAYTMDDVWHGMTLGKNADRHPRTSRNVERTILGAESLSTLASLFGRPYAQWDVYPSWELDEAWRELLAAQHHDNHECEGLCGSIGYHSMDRAENLALDICERACQKLADRLCTGEHDRIVFNELPWMRDELVRTRDERQVLVRNIPPLGWRVIAPDEMPAFESRVQVDSFDDLVRLSRGAFAVEVDRKAGCITQIRHPAFPDGVLASTAGFPSLRMIADGCIVSFQPSEFEAATDRSGHGVAMTLRDDAGNEIWAAITLHELVDAVSIRLRSSPHDWRSPDPGMIAALRTSLHPAFNDAMTIITDSPFALHEATPRRSWKRKYPTGDWMTSEQWFETIDRPFTALRYIDVVDGARDDAKRGVLYLHGGNQQFIRTDRGIEHLITARDPWDEAAHDTAFDVELWIIPHACPPESERRRLLAMVSECTVYKREAAVRHHEINQPVFGTLDVSNAPNVIAHAFFRANEKDGEHFPDWAGHHMLAQSNGACTHPFVVRLVEWDGEPANITLKFPGEIASVAKTNIMGEVGEHIRDTRWLRPEPATPPDWARETNITWSQVTFSMRPREIATIMADLVMGRKQFRDLDAKREVWATVHRTGSSPDSPERG